MSTLRRQEATIFIAVLIILVGWGIWIAQRKLRSGESHGRFAERALVKSHLAPILFGLGWAPSFSFLQLAVLEAALRLRTVSVTGQVWMPSNLEVEMSAEDRNVTVHLEAAFLRDVGEVVADLARTNRWRLDGSIRLEFTEPDSAPPCRPLVRGSLFSDSRPLDVSPNGGGRGASSESLGHTAVMRGDGPGSASRERNMMPPTNLPVGLCLAPMESDAPSINLSSADDEVIVGRGDGVDIEIPFPSVSRRHCRLRRDRGAWKVSDLDSSNGTMLNGERIGGECLLREGDIVDVGGVIRYCCQAADQRADLKSPA